MLADAAQVVDGKLYLLGGAWNRYHCRAFPTQAPMAFAASILVDPDETGRPFPVTLALVDEAGVPIIPDITAQAEVRRPEGERTPQRTLLTVSASITIPRAGRYTLQATAGGSSSRVSFDAVFVGKRVALGDESGLGN
jgi:hypothetical protein